MLIALNIAKQAHDAVIAWPSGKTMALKVANSLEGYQQLLDCAGQDPKDLCVAFEPTAYFHRNIAYWLQVHGVRCFLISSLACARAREMLHQIADNRSAGRRLHHFLRELGAGRRLDPTERCAVGVIHVNTIEEQHVEMDISDSARC